MIPFSKHWQRMSSSYIAQALISAWERLEKSVNPLATLQRLRSQKLSLRYSPYIFHIVNATIWLKLMEHPGYPKKLIIPAIYIMALLVPFTSQFFVPATPVFSCLWTWHSSRFIPSDWRPTISVALLPTLEYVLYGANISDILTRFTHPALDLLAWIPYGVVHFIGPFIVALFLWLFRTKSALHLWARTLGYMNLTGVFIHIVLPCSAPWYELVYGRTPANYGMKGSPGGLSRIDTLFHSDVYTIVFTNSPLVFGAFPSLHAAIGTLEALFLSHFFPQVTVFIWAYTFTLYWSTMYLAHHYLIDVVGGAYLAITYFYLLLPHELTGPAAQALPPNLHHGLTQRAKKIIYNASHGSNTASRKMDIVRESPVRGKTAFSTTMQTLSQGEQATSTSATLRRKIHSTESGNTDGKSRTRAG